MFQTLRCVKNVNVALSKMLGLWWGFVMGVGGRGYSLWASETQTQPQQYTTM